MDTHDTDDTPTLPAIRPATADPALLARLEAHAEKAAGAFAANTKAAYASDTRIFTAWCADRDLCALPATAATIAAFVADMATTRKPATVARYVTSVGVMHTAAGIAISPTHHSDVRLALKTMRRTYGTAQKQAPALGRGEIDRILAALTGGGLTGGGLTGGEVTGGEVTGGGQLTGGGLIGLRDAALVSVLYDTLLRRSEVVALDCADVERAADGTGSVRVRRSKGDQEGAGDDVRFLAADTVERLDAYLAAAEISEGALFRVVAKGGRLGSRLAAGDVQRILARSAARAGLGVVPTGHSLRVGAACDLATAGAELPGIMLAGGWRSATMPARYTRKANVRRGAMAKLAVQQGRA